ncbi:MAG: hypothetical protein EOL97_10040 [Spirochaetia bacterium]|nr:hypothetical protein [Spirochaetia bacterium]
MAWNEKKDNKITQDNNKELFTLLSEAEKTRGLKILCYGDFSTGKTHFGLTGDGPVYVIDTENGVVPLANKFPGARVLNISSRNLDAPEEEQVEVENYLKLQDAIDYLVALPSNEVGTIVVDSLTDVWSWCQAYAKIKKFKLSIDDRLKQQFDWGIINGMYNRIIMKLINMDCNVVFTARQSEIYSGPGQPSGQYQPSCQKKTPFFVDVVLNNNKKFVGGKFVFTTKIEKLRQNGELTGTVIETPTFEKLKKVIENGNKL